MDQEEEITINYQKEQKDSVKGKKFILSYNASKIFDLPLDENNEITIDLNHIADDREYNISMNSFKNFIEASFGENIKFESHEAIEIESLCQLFGNDHLLLDIKDFISKMPEPQVAVLRFKLNTNEDALKYIADHFSECSKCHDFMSLDPSLVIGFIFQSDEFRNHKDSDEYQHSLVRYFINLNVANNQKYDETDSLQLIDFEKLSPADIKDFIHYFPNEKERIPETAQSSIKTINDIINSGNETLKSIKESLEKSLNERDASFRRIEEQIEKINDEKNTIFSHMDEQKRRVYIVESQNEKLNTVESQYNSIKTLFDELIKYQDTIEKNCNNLEQRLSNLETTSSQLKKEEDSNE